MDLGVINKGKDILRRFGGSAGSQIAGVVDIIQSPSQEIQKAYMWEVEFIDPRAGDDIGRNLRYQAKATALPPRTQEVIKRHYAGVEYTYTGKDNSARMFRVTFWDNQALDAYRFFNSWYELTQYGSEKNKALPSTYYRDIKLSLKDNSNLFNSETFTFKNCFPYEITEASLTYAESAEFTFDVFFHFSSRSMGN
jgi:hypothetical protein